MPNTVEYRYVPLEFRQTEDGLGVVSGTIIRYGDRARLPWGSEEFRAGWAKNLGTDVMIANRMHNRDQPLGWSDTEYLTIVDDEERMTAELILPNTTAGRDAAEELSPKRRMLRGLSLEFITTKDDADRDHRVVMEGRMFGFGVVDKPAYGDSLVKMSRWVEYRSHYGLALPEPDPQPEPEPEPTPEPLSVRRYFVV